MAFKSDSPIVPSLSCGSPENMTTVASDGRFFRMPATLFPCISSSTNTTRDSEFARIYSTWSGRLDGYTGTVTNPPRMPAMSARHHSTFVAESIATLSPRERPRLINPLVISRTAFPTSRYVIGSHVPFRGTR